MERGRGYKLRTKTYGAKERVVGRQKQRERERKRQTERGRDRMIWDLNLFLFYNGYKLGRMPLFIWPLDINSRIIT